LRDGTERRFDRIVGSRPGQFQEEVGLHMANGSSGRSTFST
jgi:hypothetical protein